MSNKMPTIVKEVLHQTYRWLELDMSKARKMEKPVLERIYHEMVIIDAPADFTIRLNHKHNDGINIKAGETFEITDFNIREIYITNDAASGTQRIWFGSFYE